MSAIAGGDKTLIGSEDNTSRFISLDLKGSKIAVPVTLYNGSGQQISPSGGLVSAAYDYIARTTPDTTSEVYTFKSGGSSGSTVATITIVYTDTTLATISSVTKV